MPRLYWGRWVSHRAIRRWSRNLHRAKSVSRQANGEEEGFYVSGGMLEVQPDVVTVLSDTAMRAEDLDEAAVLRAREEAERELHDRDANIEYATALAKNAEAVAQLQAIRRMRKQTGRS